MIDYEEKIKEFETILEEMLDDFRMDGYVEEAAGVGAALDKFRLFFKKDLEQQHNEKQKEQKSLNINAASEWLRKHVCNYINSEYNEFHKRVEYDGSIDKERLINDFEEAMQKELPTNEEMLRTLRVEYEKGVADTIAKYEQKEQDKCPEYCVRSHCIGCSIYEKQKEQKLVPKFKVGDIIKKKGKEYTFTIDKIRDEFYLGDGWAFLPFDQQDKWELVEQKEQKPVEKRDLVAQLKEYLSNTPKGQLEAKWKELEKWNNVGPTVEEYLLSIKPAEWSEKDEELIDLAVEAVEDFYNGGIRSKIINLLKSLRPSWKPSEE